MIDYLIYITRLLKPKYRKPKIQAWLRLFTNQLQGLQTTVNDYMTAQRRAVAATGQVISLEDYLNELFDSSLRRIYISDAALIVDEFITMQQELLDTPVTFMESESDPTWVLYTEAESIAASDFIVNVPNTLLAVTNEIAHIIDTYKLAGKKYTIIGY